MIYKIFCSRLVFIGWLQNHLIPCPFKFLTGLDCPGCGFQRAVIALVQGNIAKSLAFYPAAVPLLLFFTYGIADRLVGLDNAKGLVKKTAFIIIGSLILVSYCLKMWHSYAVYKASARLVTYP